jgi:hypothetical protein
MYYQAIHPILKHNTYLINLGLYKSLKIPKQNLQFTSQVIQIKPCGHHGRFFNKKQKTNLEDVNLMKYNLQISNIHDWIESKLNLEV